MSNELSILIKVKNLAKQGLDSATATVRGFASSISGAFGGMFGGVKGLIAGFASVGAAVGLMKKALQQAFEVERYVQQFSILMGSMAKAREHVDALRNSKMDTLFGFPQLAEASREMLIMTEGTLGTIASLEMLGDVAAGTGKNINDISGAVAKAYGQIAEGEPIGRAGIQLRNLGIISQSTVTELSRMEEAGATNIEIWNALKASLETFNGSMDKVSGTGEGLMKQLSDTWEDTLTDLGFTFQDVAKNQIKGLIDWLNKLSESGALEEWASKAATVLEGLGTILSAVGKGFGKVYDFVATGAGVLGKISGGMSPKEAIEAQGREMADAEIAANKKRADNVKQAEDKKANEPKEKAQKKIEQSKKEAEYMAKKQIEQEELFAKEIAKAEKDLIKTHRDGKEYGIDPYYFNQRKGESTVKGKERLAEEIAAYKDRIDIAKNLKAEQDKLQDAEMQRDEQNRQRGLADHGERVAQRIDQWTGEAGRAREDRLMTTEDRRNKNRAEMKKAREHGLSVDELAAIEKRKENLLPLTKAEKMALKEDSEFAEKAEKIRDKQRAGAKISNKDMQILREAGAQAELKQAKKDELQLKADLANKQIQDKKQADDIAVIKDKIQNLLQLK